MREKMLLSVETVELQAWGRVTLRRKAEHVYSGLDYVLATAVKPTPNS